MERARALELLKAGAKEWNKVAEDLVRTNPASAATPSTQERRNQWKALARVDFSDLDFDTEIDFSGFLFPGELVLSRAKFHKPVYFDNARFHGEVSVDQAVFEDRASFDEAAFHGPANFRSAYFNECDIRRAEFRDNVRFSDARFIKGADFEATQFLKDCWWREAKFKQVANFRHTKFQGIAEFINAEFSQEVSFTRTRFAEGVPFTGAVFAQKARFEHTLFEGPTSFEEAYFRRDPSFAAMRSQSTFSLSNAHFHILPDFAQAHFDEAPYLDSLLIVREIDPDHLREDYPDSADRKAKEAKARHQVPLRWRSLRKLAAEGLDHEREQYFFAREILALRKISDRPLPKLLAPLRRTKLVSDGNGGGERREMWAWSRGLDPRPVSILANSGRYWVGIFYQFTSNFGRSITLPLIWWCIVTLAFAALYVTTRTGLTLDTTALLTPCATGMETPLTSGIALSLGRGLIISGLTHVQTIDSAYRCLYPANTIPDWLVFAGYAQTVLSVTLLFLFLLGIRNAFRMR